MKTIDYEFLDKLTMPGKIAANPAETQVGLVLSRLDFKDNQYKSNLWIYDGSKLGQFTFDDKVRDFCWEDDDHILFTCNRSKQEEAQAKEDLAFTACYRLSLQGGEASPAFHLALDVNAIESLGHGYYLLEAGFNRDLPNSYILPEDQRKDLKKSKEKASFATHLTEIPFYFNGKDYTEGDRTGLFIYHAPSGQLERISSGDLDVDFYTVSEDKARLYFGARPFKDKAQLTNCLYQFALPQTDLEAGEAIPLKSPVQLFAGEEMDFSFAWEAPLADETALFVLACDMEEYGINESPRIYRVQPESGQLEAVSDKSYEFYSCLNTDVDFGGRPGSFVKNGIYYFVATDRDHDALYAVQPGQEPSKIWDADGAILGLAPWGSGFLCTAMQDYLPAELFSISQGPSGLASKRISEWNSPLFKEYELLRPVPLPAGQAEDIDGWVIYPRDFVKGGSYPAILDVHGGPRTAYGSVFFHEMQVWAQRGYFVVYCNPRGSGGRGDAFADIRGKYGSIDYADIMSFLDTCLSSIPEIDRKRLGVTGGSYGGFMTNWIIGHTDRFAAAATQRSISNWTSFYGTSDIGYYFATDQNATLTFDQAGFLKLWEFSPLRYINACKTPTLIIHSAKDYRCPLEQGYQLFTALKDRDIPSEMYVFHEETHELSRSGKPQARKLRLQAITEWMDRYLVKDQENKQ